MPKKETPVRKQYLQIKAQHPDAILFFRLGDFYEAFDEDAEIAARELDLVLTSRPVSKGTRVPMAGVPYHAVEGYIARLIKKGYRVAIAEQVGEATGRGLVHREVRRVVTPGTVVDPALLDEKRANYLAAVVVEDGRAGLAYVDITTGEFAATRLNTSEVEQELSRLQPRECLMPDDSNFQFPISNSQISGAHVTPLPLYRFELGAAQRALLDHFDVATLDGFGCAGKPLAIRAAGAIIHYLRETQMGALAQIVTLSTYSTARFMTLDAATRRNLELTETIREHKTRGSLLGVLDLTLTPMGGRLLRARLAQPLLDLAELEARLDEVQAFYDDTILRGKVRELLKDVSDLERLTNRVLAGVARPRDLAGVRKTLEAAPELVEILEQSASYKLQAASCDDVVSLIASAIVDNPPAGISDGGVIRLGFSSELDSIATAARDAKSWIANMERGERERTGIKNLKVGHNKVFGYYIEVTKSNLDAVPEEYIRKQTLVNAERYITPELKEYEALILNAEERQAEIESRLFKEVCRQVGARSSPLLETARALARLDVASALAEIAARNRYTRPELGDDDVLELVAGRHPVVERALRDEPFTPNDLRLDSDERILVITGPNMAGKSVYLRQNALIVLMAQMGSFVPAERARIGIVDRIFTRIGAQDEVAAGQSTFMVEMVEAANILNHATPRSLLILDEIGRGTSTYDGLSIAWAVVEYLHNHPQRRARTLFATHYHELTEMSERLPAVRNYSLEVVEEGKRVVFLHKVSPGGADRSYGIHVARLAGVPRPVTQRAEELLAQLESGEFRPGTPALEPSQPALFADEHPVVEALRGLDVSTMTPLEAINELYELQRRVEE
ncbi:MAG: DNA mismatch repair protein MutS [Anaerolineaceae bacterium 4572_32.2]|nr:MAG: DNA mismatch repair protein MutS [Anaerolineaceae bacterium 4572_32.2]RLC79671.1 MAG: DNA mismatch repair protein MutS [Chloroflexota bacterium]